MAVTLTGADGLFARLGTLFDLDAKLGTHQALLDTEVTDILAEYNNDPGLANPLQTSTLNFQLGAGAPNTTLRSVARTTLIEMVNDDNQQPAQTLDFALDELIRQMEANSDSIESLSPSPTAVATADANNTGTGEVYTVVLRGNDDGTTEDNQYLRVEDIVADCTRDAQVSGTAGRETFTVRGEPAINDVRHPDWPGGSGITGSLRVTDASEDSQSSPGRNMLVNSDFETFTVTDTPDSWNLDVGSAGTQILEEGTNKYRGNKCLKFVGDAGGTLTAISQTITPKLKPLTFYTIFARLDIEDAGLVAGVLRLSVKDSTDTIIAGGNAAKSVTVSGITPGTWTTTTSSPNSIVSFYTGIEVGTGLKLVAELTTAITDTKALYIDDLVLCEMPQVGGPLGPYMVALPGDTAFLIKDRITVATTGNDASTAKVAWYMDKHFDLYQRGIRIPHSGTPTVADTVIA